MPNLRIVDSCSLQIIVDNSIEWMTKFPPGFTSELATHLQGKPRMDAKTGAPFVDLDKYCCGAHGLSLLITTRCWNEVHYTLFDTGPESQTMERNLSSLDVDMSKVERIVLSHWHRDHSGGIVAALKQATKQGRKDPIVVDLHPDRPFARGIAPNGNIIGRLPEDPTFEEIEFVGGKVETHAEAHTIAGKTVWISGEIPRVTSYEEGLLGAVTWYEERNGEGDWQPDELILDERYAAINVKGKGLVVISSCSHAGIVNVLKDAVQRFKRPIYMVLGGFHLASPELAHRIKPTVDFMSKQLQPTPKYILPLHCTGFGAKVALREALGDVIVPAGTGIKIDIDGDDDTENDLDESSYPSDTE
ncbi:metallo-beta-lactamase protein [Calocera viscosa TUFC12733]|uniref:Metallo-beta-lactamase protein n=1 Tax=Calocera viscosa (strain TUFC12733) TaxID=1330018 RepID=A0A167PN78_CALVF|nr:metallo-beta-lactamase protein [Calocera viscosa TUFC12733]